MQGTKPIKWTKIDDITFSEIGHFKIDEVKKFLPFCTPEKVWNVKKEMFVENGNLIISKELVDMVRD